MDQELLGIEVEVELGCDNDSMLGELLDLGTVIYPVSDRRIRVSANAAHADSVVAIIKKQEPQEFIVYLYDNIRNGSQKFYKIVLSELTQVRQTQKKPGYFNSSGSNKLKKQ
ncbi:MAG: hypothetical protein JXB42_10370 [Deltaproteobacteria bacterium]|nr:hypothetical protein [Deltaproteobacteria bacterium]